MNAIKISMAIEYQCF